MSQATLPVISRRQKTGGPNHHLWNNHGWWWFHGTFHLPGGGVERVRLSLKTKDLDAARHQRDRIVARYLHPHTHDQAA